MSNDVLLVAALRVIKTWDCNELTACTPATLQVVSDLRRAAAEYQPEDTKYVNDALITFRLTNYGT